LLLKAWEKKEVINCGEVQIVTQHEEGYSEKQTSEKLKFSKTDPRWC